MKELVDYVLDTGVNRPRYYTLSLVMDNDGLYEWSSRSRRKIDWYNLNDSKREILLACTVIMFQI